jgi:thiamine phosphate synthase YjbQ (UPF0047 family)
MNLPKQRDFVNITPQVEAALKKSGIQEGILLCNTMLLPDTRGSAGFEG